MLTKLVDGSVITTNFDRVLEPVYEDDGKAFRQPGATRVDVRSGIDWFELHGEVDYAGATVGLPELLGGDLELLAQ